MTNEEYILNCVERMENNQMTMIGLLRELIKALGDALSKADVEERVLVLPCKVGDTVYVNIGYAKCHIYEAEVYQFHVRKGVVFIDARYKRWSTNGSDKRHCWYEEKEYGTWGVDVFPTREDAERKLEGK